MRILLVHNTYQHAGGEDTIVRQEMELLKLKGHEVELLLFNNDNIGRTTFSRLKLLYQTVYNRSSIERMLELMKSFQPDIIHVHNIFYVASPAILGAIRERRIPVVMTLHNYRLLCAGTYLMREGAIPCESCVSSKFPIDGIRHACHRNSVIQSAQLTFTTSWHKFVGTWQGVDKYISLTDFARERFLNSSLKLRPEQIVVKPNAIADMGYANPNERNKNYLFVGRLTVEKGIEVLLESAKHYSYPLTIIGDGPLREKVESIAFNSPMINYLGPCSRDVIATELKRCRALIVPSLWYEGLPTTILEAYSTGTPVICSDQQNLNQIVRHQQTGLLFPVGSAKALANLIADIDNNVTQIVGLHERARLDYQNNYTLDQSYRNLLMIYEELIAHQKTVFV